MHEPLPAVSRNAIVRYFAPEAFDSAAGLTPSWYDWKYGANTCAGNRVPVLAAATPERLPVASALPAVSKAAAVATNLEIRIATPGASAAD